MRVLFLNLFIGGVLLSSVSPSQAADKVQILNLFDANGFVAGFLIPFQVRGGVAAGGQITSSSVETSNGADCRLMNDPFIPLTIQLKCLSATDATLHINLAAGGNAYPLAYGPIRIAKPAGIQLGDGGGDGGGSSGRQLFLDRCVRCHYAGGSAPLLNNHPSASYIYDRIHNPRSTMSTYGELTSLTMDQIRSIADYLGTL
jgi:mono/diheme cytochrome c family protein